MKFKAQKDVVTEVIHKLLYYIT